MGEREKRKVYFIESYWTGGAYGCDYCWNDNHGELIRCRDCMYWKPPHVILRDGKQRMYKKGDADGNSLGYVSSDVGINMGGRCWVDHNCGYGRDMRVYRNEDDYCSKAIKIPDGQTCYEWWGLSEEPKELLED